MVDEVTISSIYVLTSSQSPRAARTSPLHIPLSHSSVSPSHTLPVKRTCWILPGTSSFLNLKGRSCERMGMCRSPMTRTSTVRAEWGDRRVEVVALMEHIIRIVNEHNAVQLPRSPIVPLDRQVAYFSSSRVVTSLLSAIDGEWCAVQDVIHPFHGVVVAPST